MAIEFTPPFLSPARDVADTAVMALLSLYYAAPYDVTQKRHAITLLRRERLRVCSQSFAGFLQSSALYALMSSRCRLLMPRMRQLLLPGYAIYAKRAAIRCCAHDIVIDA